MRVVAAGGGVMNSITLSGLDNVSGKKDVGDLFTLILAKNNSENEHQE